MASISDQWNDASPATKALIVGAAVLAGGGVAYYLSQRQQCSGCCGTPTTSTSTTSTTRNTATHPLATSSQQRPRSVADKKHKPRAGSTAWGWIISGGPGSGKGTQCERITAEFGVVHISTGDILRAEVKKGTPLGLKAEEIMKRGELIADEIIIGMLMDRLKQTDVQERGFLLDGFPRTSAQAEALVHANVDIQAFLLLDVSQENIVTRVCGRRIDPVTGASYHITYKWPPPSREVEERLTQRKDDTEETVLKRLRTFESQNDAVVNVFHDYLIEIDGNHSIDETWDKVLEHLKMVW